MTTLIVDDPDARFLITTDDPEVMACCRRLAITRKQLALVCLRVARALAPDVTILDLDADVWLKLFMSLPHEDQEAFVTKHKWETAQRRQALSREFLARRWHLRGQ